MKTKNKNKKYKWNYKKFLKNMIYLLELAAVGIMFGLVLLGICGVDIIF